MTKKRAVYLIFFLSVFFAAAQHESVSPSAAAATYRFCPAKDVRSRQTPRRVVQTACSGARPLRKCDFPLCHECQRDESPL